MFYWATEPGRVFISRDEDRLVVADLWRRAGRNIADLMYYPQSYRAIGPVIEDLWLVAMAGPPHMTGHRVLYLPLRYPLELAQRI